MNLSVILILGFDLACGMAGMKPSLGIGLLVVLLGAAVAVSMTTEAGHGRKITAGQQRDAAGHPKCFTLSLGMEVVTLDPGKTWTKLDSFKWVTRGLIEEPQSFHVLPNGAVEINGEKILPDDADGPSKLEHEINKHHATPAAPAFPAAPGSRAASTPGQIPASNKVHFKVRLDHLGHLMVECTHGAERTETGLRGLPTLVQNGFMSKPATFHVDPLQRSVELDGARFECDAAGAHLLEETLNARYAPALQGQNETAVEIKENPAASTGFDIRFVTIRAGARFEIKGHLAQENLDILQDPRKCELLRAGTVLRLSPPYLLIRRRRPDGSEEKIPELPDVQYRHVTPLQLQQILNHPAIRRTNAGTGSADAPEAKAASTEILQMRLARNPHNKSLLWLDCVMAEGGQTAGKAFTHHNVADLRQHGAFREEVEVSVSLDHRTLRILDKPTQRAETIQVDPESTDANLAKAGLMLTAALKPPVPRRVESGDAVKTSAEPIELKKPKTEADQSGATQESQTGKAAAAPTIPDAGAALAADDTVPPGASSDSPVDSLPPNTRETEAAKTCSGVSAESSSGPAQESQPAVQPERALDETTIALFRETDPLRINTEIFRSLISKLGGAVRVQDLLLSLPRVFENRRFEVLSFSHAEVGSVLELRSAEFYGFYLSHINPQKILFVFACQGRHIEWGSNQCELQAAVTSEPEEFKGNALLGMALNRAGQFVFVVSPAYREWSKPREKHYADVNVRLATVADLASAPDEYSLIWPELTDAN